MIHSKLEVRVFGYQSDKGNIPDDQLFWANIKRPSTDASHGGIGGPGLGLIVGSMVFGSYADADKQQLFVEFSMGAAHKQKEDGSTDNTNGNNDIPVAARDKSHGGGDKRFKQFQADGSFEYDEKSITMFAKDEAPNPHQRTSSKDADQSEANSFSIGGHQYA
jgi:Gp5 N-terminal OB domain